jgi:hypothetical protein
MKGQVAVQADAEIIVQDGGGGRSSGLRGSGRLSRSDGLRGEVLKEEQSGQQGQQRMFCITFCLC